MSKQITNEEIATAIIATRTRTEAAQQLCMSVRQLYERLQSRELCALIAQLRVEQLRARMQSLADAETAAGDVLIEIMKNEEQSAETRLRAASAVLSAGRAARLEIEKAERAAIEQGRSVKRDQLFDDLQSFTS